MQNGISAMAQSGYAPRHANISDRRHICACARAVRGSVSAPPTSARNSRRRIVASGAKDRIVSSHSYAPEEVRKALCPLSLISGTMIPPHVRFTQVKKENLKLAQRKNHAFLKVLTGHKAHTAVSSKPRSIRRKNLLSAKASQSPYSHPVWQITILAIVPTIGLDIGRFAYALVLPDMRDSLGWSYSMAGFMNTINAAGYLAGALGASAIIKRFGMFNIIRISAAACVLSLVGSALTVDVVVFSAARLVLGIAAAFAFVAGGALATNIAQAQPRRQSFYLSLFYSGPAVGILISGFVAPFLLEWHGPGTWWIVWAALAGISISMALVLPLARVAEPPVPTSAAKSEIRIAPVLIYLFGYFLFGAGYISYMTFMVAYVRHAGGGALTQSIFWTCIGVGALAQPWVWSGLMAKIRGGGGTALLTGLTAVGAALPLFGESPILFDASALIFGNAFFAVVSSTTAFVRFNYPREAWPKAIAMMTVAFGVGQMLGPIGIGAITDKLGSLSYALNISAATLVLGAIACLCQRTTAISTTTAIYGHRPSQVPVRAVPRR